MGNLRNSAFLKVFAAAILSVLLIVFLAIYSGSAKANAAQLPPASSMIPAATSTVVAAQADSNTSSFDNNISLWTNIVIAVFTGLYVILTGVYVFLTLRIARKTAESVEITRKSLELARDQMAKTQKQSENTLEASKEQSDAAIKAIREQVEASEKQAREALYNQHKPVIVPVDTNPLPSSTNAVTMTMEMQNRGTGIAINTWGILSIKGGHFKYYFSKLYFMAAGDREHISFNMNAPAVFLSEEFEGYSIYPEDENGISPGARLMITYSDVFDNNYLVVFDLSEELEWQRKIFKKVDERFDKKVVKRAEAHQNNSHLPAASSSS